MKRLGVSGALVDGSYRAGDVGIDEDSGRIAAVGLCRPGRGLAIPGLIDLQVNGFAGVDFLTAGAGDHQRAATALARTGVVAYQPTLITDRPDRTIGAIIAAGKAHSTPGGARVLGVHLEGPFLSSDRPGTHPIEYLRAPDLTLARRLLAAGPVTQLTLAPELPGALELVDLCVRSGVLVSCGHSDATAAATHAAIDHGARLITHLFDAMRPFTHRDPGIVGAALTRREVAVGLIADPSHLAPEAIQLAFRAAADRIVLVTDALAAGGCPDGHYRLGSVGFEVSGGVARRADGTLVGTTITLLGAVRHACDIGITSEAAVNAATGTPARLFPGADIGLSRPGDRADVLVLDDAMRLRYVFHRGIPVEPGE
ncbi:N-acetylglucosamine-6-phosphate deacetylase [Amycolatopsis decaplanina]|uniref:N-acetylglucosamine-6-phosphate deacetylase n=1 Tax=Amycolatopsis decaplanina DSM 44594 TaxID=1284240 RepID=M2Z3G6_9PSEU|nr:N-acetylglucosamine-6-phosphate deacetylase [Amycolatopsis decaplanina]EME55114.1 N-acetylglucosamine-6-phosphate deacetylase [Amycolatopsis decaplanina DSM 44594]